MRIPISLYLADEINTVKTSATSAHLNIFETEYGMPDYLLEDARFIVFTNTLYTCTAVPIKTRPYTFIFDGTPFKDEGRTLLMRLSLKLYNFQDRNRINVDYDALLYWKPIKRRQFNVPFIFEIKQSIQREYNIPLFTISKLTPKIATPIKIPYSPKYNPKVPINLNLKKIHIYKVPIFSENYKVNTISTYLLFNDVLTKHIPINLKISSKEKLRTPILIFNLEGSLAFTRALAGLETESVTTTNAIAYIDQSSTVSTSTITAVEFFNLIQANAVAGAKISVPVTRIIYTKAIASVKMQDITTEYQTVSTRGIVGVELPSYEVLLEVTALKNISFNSVRVRVFDQEYVIKPLSELIFPVRIPFVNIDGPIAVIRDIIRQRTLKFSDGEVEMIYRIEGIPIRTYEEQIKLENAIRTKTPLGG